MYNRLPRNRNDLVTLTKQEREDLGRKIQWYVEDQGYTNVLKYICDKQILMDDLVKLATIEYK